MQKKGNENYFLFFISILPLTFFIGPTVSLINVLSLNLLYLIILFKEKNFNFKNDISFKLILILYLYLIFNSFISLNYEISLKRNLGFIRVFLLFLGINYFFFKYPKSENFLKIWSVIILIFCADIFLEKLSGTNILGWGADEINGVPQVYGNRIVSFFKDEPIAGAYLSAFIFLISAYVLEKSKNKIFPIILLLTLFLAILVSGERSNTLKVLIGILIFISLLDFTSLKKKILIISGFFLVFLIVIGQSEYLKTRYLGQFYSQINSKEKLSNFIHKSEYFKLYRSGYAVFENNFYFGVGNKNYRVEACENKKASDKYICNTHPHQIYFELLSEHGFIGTLILLSIFFYLFFIILREILISRNLLQIGTFTFVLISFIPLLPSGAFFGDFNLTLFWINFSIMFACNKKTNIFAKKSF